MFQNVDVNIKDNKLTLIIDISKSLGRSRTGKSEMIATSAGAVKVGDDIKINLNIYK